LKNKATPVANKAQRKTTYKKTKTMKTNPLIFGGGTRDTYLAPDFETVVLTVEQGFAASDGLYANDELDINSDYIIDNKNDWGF